MGAVSNALFVAIGQAGLLAIGIGKPAKEMIEAAVFHGDHDHVIDAGISRVRQIRERGARGGGLAEGPRRSECGGSGSQREIFHKLTTIYFHQILRQRNRRRAYCCSAIAAEGGIWSFMITDKIARVYEFQVKCRYFRGTSLRADTLNT